MLSVRLPDDMQKRIDNLAKSTKRPKSFFVKEALKNYIDDMEDYYEVLKREDDKDRKIITLDELERALDL
jgi:RHH-type rel operon transcriptional repressor/antitoxin RelB